MAQKKRKQLIKLNKKIKSIFEGEVFEEGIKKIPTQKLSTLYSKIFGEKAPKAKDEMIKSICRVWSEANFLIRKEIVEFLDSKNRDKIKIKEIILEILDDLELEQRELNLLIESSLQMNPSKLNREKLIKQLSYIRFKEQINQIESALEVEFNSLNEMEFVHSFEFKITGASFSKLILLRSHSIDLKELLQKSQSQILKYLNIIKSDLISQKEIEIEEFTKSLLGNRYLSLEKARALLKRLPVDTPFNQTPIDTKTITEIIQKNSSDNLLIVDFGGSFEIEMMRSIEILSTPISYKLTLSYQKKLLFSIIWDNQELPILDDFEELNNQTITEFWLSFDELKNRVNELAQGLNLEEENINNFILEHLESSIKSSGRLKIKAKTIRKIIYHFKEFIKPIKERVKKEELLAKSIRDFKLLYPLARGLKRKITFHVGPTNSGKTFQAMERLKSAESGFYLAPLRLLALEGFETLKDSGVNASLITGEEEIIDEDSTHISSTIEMLNSDVEVDVCVIDEIQMISDKDRGWAWVNALIGAPAKEVILTGSTNALEVVKMVCKYLGEELEIIEFDRKNSLKVMDTPTPIDKIKPNSAIVTFSRRDVLALKQKLSKKYSVSVIYGNLSPEVRREEAKRFREGKSSVLIATDAIAMGLNLPIHSIIFAKDNKFDGLRRRELEAMEVIQIAGRAGRFGLYEEGFVGALDKSTLKTISKKLKETPPQIKPPLSVMATLEHIELIGQILESDNLLEILEFFSQNMEFEGPFIANNIESMIELAQIVDEYDLDLKTKYIFASAPVSLSSAYLESVFHRYLEEFQNGDEVEFVEVKDLPAFAYTQDELLEKEDRVKEVSLYLWLSFKFPEKFTQTQKAITTRDRLNSFIEETLKRGEFKKSCRICKKELDFSYKFNICERCFRKKRFRV